jgi:hypothetical protein
MVEIVLSGFKTLNEFSPESLLEGNNLGIHELFFVIINVLINF